MTMPQGPGGLNTPQFFQENQDNPAPPTDPWISEFTNTNNLNQLHYRTQPFAVDYYRQQITTVDTWDDMLDGFRNLLGNLPEWLSALEPILLWIGETFTEAFKSLLTGVTDLYDWISENIGVPVFETVLGFLDWLNTNVGVPVLETIFNLLKWINDNVGSPLVQAIFNFLKWINDNISFPIVETLMVLIRDLEPVLEWLGETFGTAGQLIYETIADLVGWIDTNVGIPLFKTLSELLKWINDNIGVELFKTVSNFLKWINDTIGIPLTQSLLGLVQTLEPVLEWIGDTFSEVFQGLLTGVTDLYEWIKDGIGEVVLKPVLTFLGWLWDLFGDGVEVAAETVLQPLFTFLKWLWDSFGDTVESILKPMFSGLAWIWETFGATVQSTLIEPAANFLDWLFNDLLSESGPILQPLFTFLKWLWDQFGAFDETVLRPMFQGIAWVWEQFGAAAQTSIIEPAANFVNWLFNDLLSGSVTLVDDLLKPIFNFLTGLFQLFDVSSLEEMFLTLKSLMDSAGGTLLGWVSSLPTPAALIEVIKTFTGGVAQTLEQALSELLAFVQKIPIIGPIVSSLLGDWKNPLTGTNETLSDLTEWAKTQLTVETIVPAQNLIGEIPQELVALLPIGHIGEAQPNLVNDQGFRAEAALQAGGGWLWDGTTTFPGSSGGSAMVLCDGGVKRLFSNLIAIAPNQSVELSAVAKWSKPSSASPTITIGVRGYSGSTVLFTSIVASVKALAGYSGSSAGTYLPSAGTTATSESGWVRIKGTYTVPAAGGADSIRMFLGVTNGPQATTVWFDESVMKKVSLLPQTLVNDLETSLSSKLPGTDFNALLDRVADKTGASLNDVQNAVSSFLKSGSPLNGNNIKSGNISAQFISELLQTWNGIYSGVTNGATPPSAALQWPTGALKDFSVSMSNQGSTIQSVQSNILQNTSNVNSLAFRTNQLETGSGKLQTSVKELQDAVKELQQSVSGVFGELKDLQEATQNPVSTAPTPSSPVTTDPTTPVTVAPPTIVSAQDDFERTSLGANWNIYQSVSDGSSLGIPNGHDAAYIIPAVGNGNSASAWWRGPGNESLTEYQRIYATAGSQSSFEPYPTYPAIGQSFIELSGRIRSQGFSLLCRFYANGDIRFFYRNGAAGNAVVQVGGTYRSPVIPTTGTLLEFLCGNKAASDQRQLFAKVGTAVFGPVYVGGSVLANMGKGWGWGMGYGFDPITRATRQPGTLNIWGAQDQV